MNSKSEAIFGLQCFWGSEAKFGALKGVISTSVGYTGGSTHNPIYKNLCDHTEVVAILFNPQFISFKELLDVFWSTHDPTYAFKRQYMSAIFYKDEEQKQMAEQTIKERQKLLSKPIVTQVLKSNAFYLAEDYHQKYFLRKHPSLLSQLNLSDSQLVDSPTATRLNSFCAGFGTVEQLQQMVDNKEIQLSEDNHKLLTALIKGGPNLGEC